jgi:hypothetical protein
MFSREMFLLSLLSQVANNDNANASKTLRWICDWADETIEQGDLAIVARSLVLV